MAGYSDDVSRECPVPGSGGIAQVTSLRTAKIASLAALCALLAACSGPSDEERALRERAIVAEAKAAAAQAKATKLASNPAPTETPAAGEQADPDAAEAEQAAETEDGPYDPTPPEDQFDTEQAAAAPPPEIPFMEPPAMIDVPQPDFEPPSGPGVEYVQVNS